MNKIINWFKNFWKKQEEKVEDVLNMQFPQENEDQHLCPKCSKNFGCMCND